MVQAQATQQPLYEGAEWTFKKLDLVFDAIEEIAKKELGLDVYPNQIEVITAEQMLDAYSGIGMPLMYNHWSFGKSFVRDEFYYRKGMRGLAYEIVINSSPCISYVMEENSMTMQALVIAHAAFGHNHFFKNNHLFRQWTDAEAILDYMHFARKYIGKCEERYGVEAVEELLDAAHALRENAVDRYSRPAKLSHEMERQRMEARQEHERTSYRDIWRTLPERSKDEDEKAKSERQKQIIKKLGLPEANLLYFLEKHSPALQEWQREILRIVRNIAQYFYPQKQTKVMNEGCACFCHYFIMNRLFDKGLITEGSMLEFIDYHTRVVAQPDFDDPRWNGINPYALGFAMMQDIYRICHSPTEEDRAWFPDIAGCGEGIAVLKDAWANFRDESFILQFLSPKLIRDFRLFQIHDNSALPHLKVEAIHNEQGYRKIRSALAKSYTVSAMDLDIQVADVEFDGDRALTLRHMVHNDVPIEGKEAEEVMKRVAQLWGYDVGLYCEDAVNGKILATYDVTLS
ncbi:SpoVR family protein [Kiloniella laminariae]|uniref:SpoVR family protein n=1 Tax=Kiloniella laminariae TaxID=454162 RepID=A0ABT4LI65_9PROT|nr:SpoVR family protein [Kiloniella laminariae]MCZ4280783.1 SpoVR family protein [Kiloniella laminariae]